MRTSFIIIDDFLDNAMALRNVALGLDYPEPKDGQYFPGRNSYERVPIAGLDEQVSRILGERVEPCPGTGHGRFRVALEGDEGEGDIHIDQSHWSGILYMTPDEHAQGGTDFFRHLPTNSDHAPLYKEDIEKLGLNDYSEVWTKVLEPDTKDRSKWEHVMRVPMRFNRLVLFRPWFFHNAGINFGDSIENGRLVYLLFFNCPDYR